MKAQKISEFEFNTRDRANVTIKVGTLETTLIIRKLDTGGWALEKSKELIAAEQVVTIDYSDITAEYEDAYKNFEVFEENRKRKEAGVRYDGHWSVKALGTFKHPKVTLHVQDRQEYIDANWDRSYAKPSSHITYGTYKECVRLEDVGDRWAKNWKFVLDGPMTNYRRRNYAKLESLADKFVELVDQSTKAQVAQKAEAVKRQEMINGTTRILTQLFPQAEVVQDSRWHGGRNGRGSYSVIIWKLKFGPHALTVLEGAGYGLNQMEDPKTATFTLSGIPNLTVNQINEIITLIG